MKNKKVLIILIVLFILIILGILICSGILNPDKDLIYINNTNYVSINARESGHGMLNWSPDEWIPHYYVEKTVKNDGTIYNSNTMTEIDKFNLGELFTLKCNIAKLKMYIQIYDVPEADKTDTDKIVKIEDRTYRIKSIEILQNRAGEIYEKIEKQVRDTK